MRLVPLAIALALSVPATARADIQQWNELGIDYEIVDDLSFSFDQHIRFDNDISRLGALMPEPALEYQFAKWLRAAVGYRMEYERDPGNGDMRTHHRFFANVRPRHDIGKVRLGYRLQFQDVYRPDDADDTWRQTVRNKLDVSYREYKPWIPSVSGEIYNTIDQGFELAKIRLTAGVAYSKKKDEWELYYRAEIPQADPMDTTAHILGLAYHREL